MPVYLWRNEETGEEVSVTRRVADIELGPGRGCPKCGSTNIEARSAPGEKILTGICLDCDCVGWEIDPRFRRVMCASTNHVRWRFND